MYAFPIIGALLTGPMLAVVFAEAGCPGNVAKISIKGTEVCCPGNERILASGGYCVVGCGQDGIPTGTQSCTTVAVTASDYSQQVFGTAAASGDDSTDGSDASGGDSEGVAGPLQTPAPLMTMAGVALAGAAML